MSSTIPPLLSNTPPPIDFENDDDFSGFDGNDSTFCHYDDGIYYRWSLVIDIPLNDVF